MISEIHGNVYGAGQLLLICEKLRRSGNFNAENWSNWPKIVAENFMDIKLRTLEIFE